MFCLSVHLLLDIESSFHCGELWCYEHSSANFCVNVCFQFLSVYLGLELWVHVVILCYSGPAACRSCWPLVSETGSWHRLIFGLGSPGASTLPWVDWVVLGWLAAGLMESQGWYQSTRGQFLVLASLTVWPGVSQGSWLWHPGDPEAGTGQW